jgi:haloalkane dehalogenase
MTYPDWLDRSAYPFPSSYFDTGAGRMHVVEAGDGPAVLLVHGTPTWSFLYRRIISDLRRAHRVMAPDLLGFGLSDKPETEAIAPPRQAERLRALVDHLGLDQFALVVHDFGGPIGLSLALDRPEQVTRLVLFNTWMWPRTDALARWASRFFGTRLGRWMYTRWNFSPNVMLPALTHQRLTPAVHAHYQRPFLTPTDRHAPWVFARDLVGADDWYASLWSRRERLRDIPALLLWGERDPGFGPDALARWQGVFDHVETTTLPDAGHLPQEEASDAVQAALGAFLKQKPDARGSSLSGASSR